MLQLKPGKPLALRVVAETVTYTYVGGGRIGNIIEHVKVYVVGKAESRNGKLVTYIHHKPVPIIPATSIKGVLRSLAERLAKRLFRGGSVPEKLARMHHQPSPLEEDVRRQLRLLAVNTVHSGQVEVGDRSLGFEFETLEDLRRDGILPGIPGGVNPGLRVAVPKETGLKEAFQEYLRESFSRLPPEKLSMLLAGLEAGADKLFEQWASTLCPICMLFGSPLHGGALRLTPLLPESLNAKLVRRHHVALERARKVKAEGKLYAIECLEPGVKLYGLAYILLPPDHEKLPKEYRAAVGYAARLLEALTKYLEHIEINIGGSASRGYGVVKLKLEPVD